MESRTAFPDGQHDPAHSLPHTNGPTRTHLQFRVDEKTDDVVITVRRRDNGEVIREIPVSKAFSLVPMPDATRTGQVIHTIA